MRVALVLRSAEVQPVFQDLCIWKPQGIQVTIPPFPLSIKQPRDFCAWF